jgi:hypothetical protein
MKKKTSHLQLNKKQISILNQSSIKGGMRTNLCPELTVRITICYGGNVCQKWPD